MKRTLTLSLVVIATISVGFVLGFVGFTRPASCSDLSTTTASTMRSQLQPLQFGAIRKYKLPSERSPNAITVASDGSVWFGEQSLPGIAHLYTNGTLVEYAWPFRYKFPAGFTFIWGIAIWGGCVWASDQADSQLVAVDPNTGGVRTIPLAAGSFPYTMTVAPDDTLWFTEVFAKVAHVDDQFNLHEYQLPDSGTPGQIVFANDSLGYYVDTGNVGIANPGIYSFDPSNFSPTLIDPSTISLIAPTSIALVNGGIWVAQHATSELAYYRFGSHELVQFPTTPVSYVKTTLPYFVAANGSLVWFNEHYANRIGVIDTRSDLLTEYSLSNPPANKTSQIDNALTFAIGGSRVWFTELTADYVGYIDATYKPSYSFQPVKEGLELTVGRSETTTLALQGVSNGKLTITASDSSILTPTPQTISLNLSNNTVPPIHGQVAITLTVTLSDDAIPGQYELLVTATDGLTGQGIYVPLLAMG